MKTKILLSTCLLAASALGATSKNCGCECCIGKDVCCCASETTPLATSDAVKRHPLRGVITAVHVDRGSIMVKHEEIPGVMRAMTMMFRVDEATLKSVQKGQSITAMMSRQADEWWLHDVKVVAPAPAK